MALVPIRAAGRPFGGRIARSAALLGVVTGALWAGAATAQAATLAVDKVVSTNQTTAATSIVSPAFGTSAGNELLVAFVTSDGPLGTVAQTFSGVTGAGVTWTLRRRANTQYGTSEIWTAVAAAPVPNATVTARRLTGSYVGS